MKSRLVVAAVIKKGDEYLFGQKPNNKGPYPNAWHLLGGGVDLEKETVEEAVIREIKEEAGIEVENIQRVSFDEDYEKDKHGEMTHYVFLAYQATYKSGALKAQDDIATLQWFTLEELRTIPLTRPTIKLFKEVGYLV